MFYMQIPQRSQRQSCEAVEEGGAQGAAAVAEGVGKDVEEGRKKEEQLGATKAIKAKGSEA